MYIYISICIHIYIHMLYKHIYIYYTIHMLYVYIQMCLARSASNANLGGRTFSVIMRECTYMLIYMYTYMYIYVYIYMHPRELNPWVTLGVAMRPRGCENMAAVKKRKRSYLDCVLGLSASGPRVPWQSGLCPHIGGCSLTIGLGCLEPRL